ncbi:hypothetical protein C1H57_00365 [Clostridium sp. 2-1]|uniref:hypothetical protein n=1 Tax=Clostridium TaxID=1485 RepID=UPI000CDA2522|nr:MULTISPECIES: hypothetical protein [Clostridium]MBN7573054.1 hypothetical protein [Clostridium beijerinckii]MBN7578393.1 hypothetical protein [Clostridium beijerinckii]MBN7582828.1 hypothetical protein [Clostridium beijerinckii]MBO0518993.1 hypothetical protein [Clostridium beijerinckii]POO93258.1 hypothetical protein C1H57_00365 [Clostridium sp. 2-1]
MDEREELKEELKAELQWIKYRIRMLDIIEERLLKMREIIGKAKELNLNANKVEEMNMEINDLAQQIRALDGESRKTENIEIDY